MPTKNVHIIIKGSKGENCASQKKEVGRQAKEKWLLKQFPFVKKYYPFLHTYVYVFCQNLPKG